jgi:hypothetical protein
MGQLGEEQREHMAPRGVSARVILHAGFSGQLRNQMIGNEVANLTQDRKLTFRWLLSLAFLFHNRALWHGARQKPTFCSPPPSPYGMAVFGIRDKQVTSFHVVLASIWGNHNKSISRQSRYNWTD